MAKKKNMKKFAALGDIHGRDTWKFEMFGSSYEFERWVETCVNNDIAGFMADQYPFNEFEKIIFIGDYVDSFDVGNAEMKKNLEDIILFKKTFPDKVVLLLGNHDIQYIVSNQRCSGYRPEMQHDFYKIFNDNIRLFQIAYELPTYHTPTLFTHAGVTEGWLNELREYFIETPSHKREMFAEIAEYGIVDLLNAAWELNVPTLYNVDSVSGGSSKWAGPLWVRPHVLKLYAIPGYDQVVGHTPCAGVQMHPNRGGETVTYTIDCLEHYYVKGMENYLKGEYEVIKQAI
jgi:hypothetical protein